MTQQSLITRLKAVEQALDTLNRNRHCACKECCKAAVALSDLRELIKEAEGLECYGVINSDNDVEYSASYPQACHDHINAALQQDEPDEDAKNWVVRRLFFTALGEKP